MEKVAWFNDIEVADNGTVYATVTGVGGDKPDPASWQVWKIAPDGTATIFVQGARRFVSRTASPSTRRTTSSS